MKFLGIPHPEFNVISLLHWISVFISSAVKHIWRFVDRMKFLSQTCLGALCELWIKSQSKLIIIPGSVVLGLCPGSLHGPGPIHSIHSSHTVHSLGESYHSSRTFHLSVPQQTGCHNTWGKLWSALLNTISNQQPTLWFSRLLLFLNLKICKTGPLHAVLYDESRILTYSTLHVTFARIFHQNTLTKELLRLYVLCKILPS